MSKQKNGAELLCPYCASVGDCPHLVAVLDSMGEWYEGYAFERYGELREVIEGAFRELLRHGARKKHAFSDPEVGQMWRYTQKLYTQKHRSPKEGEDIELDNSAFDEVIFRLLQDAGAVRQDGVDHPGVPGYESTMSVFHAETPKTVYEAVLSKLTELLKV
jgi:hypothetical protein